MKLFYIEHRESGNILGAYTVLNLAGSLRYCQIQQFCYNAHFVQQMRTLYPVFPCKLQGLILQYRVFGLKLWHIKHTVYGYIFGACTAPYTVHRKNTQYPISTPYIPM